MGVTVGAIYNYNDSNYKVTRYQPGNLLVLGMDDAWEDGVEFVDEPNAGVTYVCEVDDFEQNYNEGSVGDQEGEEHPPEEGEIDNTLPGEQPEVDNELPEQQPEVDNTLPEHGGDVNLDPDLDPDKDDPRPTPYKK